MKRTIRLLGSVILLVSMSLLGVISSTGAQQGCSLASLKGAYGLLITGFFQLPGTTVASFPSVTLILLIADGAGGLSGTFSASQNGTIVPAPPLPPATFTANYVVSPDCTGSVLQDGHVAANFVIVARGNQILVISPGPGSVQTGVAIKQNLSACSLTSLQGTYGVDTSGFFQPAGTTAASSPFASVGVATADGAGHISGSFTESDNGTIRSASDTGTYTVNSDCTGSATFASGGRANFVIVARGNQVLFIQTVPGSVQSGVAILSPSALISTFTTIDVPNSIETEATEINNPGQIAGDFGDLSGAGHGFVLAAGSFSTVDVPGSLPGFTIAFGINDRGQITGNYRDSTVGHIHGFLLSNGSFTTIDFPGATATRARGINNPGAIVGRYGPRSATHGFLFASGSFSTIDFPGSIATAAFGINDLGQIVGNFKASNGAVHGFLLSSGSFSVIDFPGSTFTTALGINNRDEIVGSYTDTAGITHGFLLSGGSFKTVDFPGSTETDANGINDVGQIVGDYEDSRGMHGFLAHR